MGSVNHRAAAFVLALALAGCASPAGERAQLARDALIGLSEAELRNCAGAPDRSRETDSVAYFTYETGGEPNVPSPTIGVYGGTQTIDSSFDVPLATRLQADYCEATFTLVDGRVARLAYNSTRGGRHAECARIVEGCLAAAAAPEPR